MVCTSPSRSVCCLATGKRTGPSISPSGRLCSASAAMSAGEEGLPPVELADAGRVATFIFKCTRALLEENGDGSEAALWDAIEEGKDSVKTFIASSQTHTLVLRKITPEEDEEETPGSQSVVQYAVGLELRYHSSRASCLAFIKRGTYIEADKPIPAQVYALHLSEDAPLETLHSYVKDAVAPFFKSYVEVSGKAERYVRSLGRVV